MAKVKNSYIGQLSGKLGGMIFSRNRGGDYVRAGVKGINPQTQSQLRARNAFASVTTLFRTLTSAEKSAWQEFADNWYSPRQGGNVGQFSAYNAFIALRSTVQQSIRLAKEPSYEVNSSSPTGGYTFVEFTQMPETPLALGLASGVKLASGDSAQLSLKSVAVLKDGKCKIVIQPGDGNGLELANNIDIYGNYLGYAVYITNGNPSDNMSYNNEFAQCLGFAKPINVTDPGNDLTTVNDFSLIFNDALSTGEFKRFPLLGEYVNVTVLVMNKYGMFSRLGSLETQIASSF